jgi:hypothetical protein
MSQPTLAGDNDSQKATHHERNIADAENDADDGSTMCGLLDGTALRRLPEAKAQSPQGVNEEKRKEPDCSNASACIRPGVDQERSALQRRDHRSGRRRAQRGKDRLLYYEYKSEEVVR